MAEASAAPLSSIPEDEQRRQLTRAVIASTVGTVLRAFESDLDRDAARPYEQGHLGGAPRSHCNALSVDVSGTGEEGDKRNVFEGACFCPAPALAGAR
jgi:hypothetical protein